MATRLLFSSTRNGSRRLLKHWVLAAELNTRHASNQVKRGTGGRSSFSGVVATVFGATGFIGRYVVNRLGRMGSQVIVPYRGDEHDYRHLRLMGDIGQVVFLDYNLRDPESIRKVVQYSNVVVNLVGREYETRNFKFNDVCVDGARAIAEACRDCGVETLIHFSALNAAHDSPSRLLQAKALGEEAVREVFPSATIVRPADVYGHEDSFLRYYAKLHSMPLGMVPLLHGGKDVVKRPVYVGDVASAVVQLIADPSVELCELVGPKGYPLPEMVEFIYKVMYRRCSIVTPPTFLFKMAAYLMELSPFVPYMTRDRLIRLHLSNTPTPGVPKLEDLGIEPAALEDKAISFLRMYRDFLDTDRPIEDTHPAHAEK